MVRTKIGHFYVQRNRLGQIKKWIRIGRSLSRDRVQHAKRTIKSGYGNLGDLKRKRR